ncbi:MAG: amino acid permease [Bacteroidales bacterium]|jgi:APA family basic amino acid/polyamine antiporter
MDTNSGKKTFRQTLGLFDSTMIVVGSMIGSGIFIVSADIARTVGSPFYLLLTWLITGIITIIAALSYGELAAMMPKAGGQYVYLKEAYNSMIGFLYGWTFFLVIQTGTIAAVAVAFAKFTGVLIPSLSEKNILFDICGFHISAAQLLAIASLIVLTITNYRGIRNGKILQVSFTVTKILVTVGLIIIGFIVASSSNFWSLNFSNMWHATTTLIDKNNNIISINQISGLALVAAMGVAMVGSVFSSDAWNNVTFIAGEIKQPKRNIPLSLFWGVLIVTVIYLLANIAYLLLLPLNGTPDAGNVIGRGIQFATSDRVGVAAAIQIFGDSAAIIMAALIMISTFGCNNGLILAGARVYYAMAKDGLFFKKVGTINKFAVPGFALVIQCIWACFLCLSGKYSDLLDYVVFAVMIFYILTISGLFILRKKRPDAERPYKAFGYPVLPAIYILFAIAFCIDLLLYKPNYTWPGMIIVLIGIPVYYIMKKYIKPSEQESLNEEK